MRTAPPQRESRRRGTPETEEWKNTFNILHLLFFFRSPWKTDLVSEDESKFICWYCTMCVRLISTYIFSLLKTQSLQITQCQQKMIFFPNHFNGTMNIMPFIILTWVYASKTHKEGSLKAFDSKFLTARPTQLVFNLLMCRPLTAVGNDAHIIRWKILEVKNYNTITCTDSPKP